VYVIVFTHFDFWFYSKNHFVAKEGGTGVIEIFLLLGFTYNLQIFTALGANIFSS